MNTVMIGENIKKLRINRGLSQNCLADFLGVDQSMICKIEKGSRSLSADLLEKLSYLFGVPMSAFEKENLPEETLAYAFRSNEISADDLEAICAINKIALNLEEMDLWLEEGKQ